MSQTAYIVDTLQVGESLQDHPQQLHQFLSILQELIISPDSQQSYIKLMQDIRQKFSSPSFLIPVHSKLRKEFFEQICNIVLTFAEGCLSKDISTLEEYRLMIKYPIIILCLVFTQLLEIKDALPRDFLLLLNMKFSNLAKPQIFIPYLTIIFILLNEIDIDEIDCSEELSGSNLSHESESAETNTSKKVVISQSTITNFFNLEGLHLIASPIEFLKSLSSTPLSKVTQQLGEMSLTIIVMILKNLTPKSTLLSSFKTMYENELKMVVQSFIVVLKSISKQTYFKLLSNMFEFMQLLYLSTDITTQYALTQENLEYTLQHFNADNNALEYFDFNMCCIDFIQYALKYYFAQCVTIQEFPLMCQVFKQSARINLIHFENQLTVLNIWSHYINYLLSSYEAIDTSQQSDFTILANLNHSFLEALETNKQFLFHVQSNMSEFQDTLNFIEELCSQLILSNLIENKIFLDFINNLSILSMKDLLLYYAIQKFLMKQYLRHMEQLSKLYTKFGKTEEFLKLTHSIFNSFNLAQVTFCSLDLDTATRIELKIKFLEDVGARLFNLRLNKLEQAQITNIFTEKIINPMSMLDQAVFSKLPEKIISLNEIQFNHVCLMMSSVHYFACQDNRNDVDFVFPVALNVSLIEKIITFCKGIIQDEKFWINKECKKDIKKMKMFYSSSIYWIIFASQNLVNMNQIFEEYFLPKCLNICILNSVLKHHIDKILPNQFLSYIQSYLKNFIEGDGFTELIQHEFYRKKILKLMVSVSKSIPYEMQLDYSKIELAIAVYLNKKCEWLKQSAFNNLVIASSDVEKYQFVKNIFSIIHDIYSIAQRQPKLYAENTIIGLKRNYFLNRLFYVVIKCSTLIPFESILDNHTMKQTLLMLINFSLKRRVDFLQTEEIQNENIHLFNFILQSKASDQKLVLDFCEKVLSYFKEDTSNNSEIQKLAKFSKEFQEITLQLFEQTWMRILNCAGDNSDDRIEEFKEREITQITEFILKFAKCLSGDLNILNDHIMISIQKHPLFSYSSQEALKAILSSLVIKQIEGVNVLQNIFIKSIIKDLSALAQLLRFNAQTLR